MRFRGTLIKEQNVKFAVIAVKPHVLNNPQEAESIQELGVSVFGSIPIILSATNSQGRTTYYGRSDIAKFLSNTDPRLIPWKMYTVSSS